MSQGPVVSNPPVHIGQEIEVKIDEILPNGIGVARLSNKKLYKIFVEVVDKDDKINAGDIVKVSIESLMSGFASAIKIG